MRRSTARWIAMVVAGLAFAGTASAADEVKKRPVAPRGFYAKFLAPKMASGMSGQIAAAAEIANPAANPWTRDGGTVLRVEKGAIQATTSALKNYAIESLGINTWSLPLARGAGNGLDALKTQSDVTRLRFGFAHMAPRAQLLIPVNDGRFAISADVRGRLGATFESVTSNFRVGLAYDAPAHAGSFSLSRRF